MTVIDLNTFDLDDEAALNGAGSPPSRNYQPSRNVINLDTGEFESPRAPLQQPGAPLQQPGAVEMPIQQPQAPTVKEMLSQKMQELAAPIREPQAIAPEIEPGLPDPTELGASRVRRPKPAVPETRAVRELPELPTSGLLSGESAADVAKVATVLMTTTDPREMGDILTENFPHIGITEDENGNLIANNNNTGVQTVLNKPGLSQMDVLQTIGLGAAYTSPAQLTTAIGTKFGFGLIKKMIAGGASAGTLQTMMEVLQDQMGGEIDVGEIATATGLGAGAEAVMPLVNVARQKSLSGEIKQSLEAAEDVAGPVQAGREAAEATGIDLFPAQLTTVPAQLEKQSFVAQLPAGTHRATEALSKQNVQAADAVDNVLKLIAPDESVEIGAKRIRSVSVRAVNAAKDAREELASPFYKKAFKENPEIDLSPVRVNTEEILARFPESGEVAKTVRKAQELINESSTLEQLHGAKVEIDQMINKVGEGALGNETKANLMKMKYSLLDQLDKGSALYTEARQKFIAASPRVNQIEESIIGKVADLDDTQLKYASKRIFDPAETNSEVISNAKKAITAVDPNAWNMILRSELERRLGSIKSTMEAGSIENIPDQLFRAVFGNARQRKVLYTAADPETKKTLNFLETALNRARLGRRGGSQTATRGEIVKELQRGVGGFFEGVRNLFSRPAETLTGIGRAAEFDKNVRVLTNALFDPQWKAQVKKLRKLNPNTPASARAMTQLLDDVLAASVVSQEDPDLLEGAMP